MISNFDWNVGRIQDTLETLGLANNTILVVSSDHGDFLGSHYGTLEAFSGKSVIYAESLDVPFILCYPQMVAPVVVNDVFTSVDIMLTLLGLCGLPIPESVTPEEYAQFLESLFAAWSHDGYGTVSVRLFDSITNALYNGLPGSCVLEVACARSLVVEYNGDVYPCDFYVTEEQLLGNVHTHTYQELMVAPARVRLEREKGQLPEACVRCSYVALCYGGCPKYRRINAALGGDGLFYFCPAYKALFERWCRWPASSLPR